MNLHELYNNFFVKRTAFLSGWRGLIIIVLSFLGAKGMLEEVVMGKTSLGGALGSLGIFSLFVYIYYRLWLENEKHEEFLVMLWREKDNLVNGGTIIHEQGQISMTTEVVYFNATFSCIFLTLVLPSRHLVPDKDSVVSWGMTYNLISLLLGWWGLPWGPIRTVQTLLVGVTGGERQTIGDIIEDLKNTINKQNK